LYDLRHESALPLKILFETSYNLGQIADWKIGNITVVFQNDNSRGRSAAITPLKLLGVDPERIYAKNGQWSLSGKVYRHFGPRTLWTQDTLD